MKKRLKILSCLSLAVLLTACNGTSITREQAEERINNIINYIADNNTTLYKNGINVKTLMKSADQEISVETSLHEEKMFFYQKMSVKSNNGYQNIEMYLGEIDGKYYQLDPINKTYSLFASKEAFSSTFISQADDLKYSINEALDELKEITSEKTYSFIETEKGESIIYKSKGEGHLYIEAVEKDEDDEGNEVIAKSILVVDEYRLVSAETIMNDEGKTTVSLKANYRVTPKMPSINGYKEK